MAIKIEINTTTKLPAKTVERVEKMVNTLPKEHLRGLDRIRLVDRIVDSRLRHPAAAVLPGLYHPKAGPQPAWIEISIQALLPQNQSVFKRLLPRLSFKGNLAAVLFSLVGQHYYQTLRHSVKRGQIEGSVRTYTAKHLKVWSEKEHNLRSRLFKPLQPTLEKWARSLQRRANSEKKKAVN
jgi:hypothetical protein